MIVRHLLAMIGFVSTATVISAVLGFGYLWHTKRVDDDKVFRIVALLHDIDLERMASDANQGEGTVPPEEVSLSEVEHHSEVFDRNVEMKMLALQRGQLEFGHMVKQLEEKTNRFDRLSQEWEQRLQTEGELSSKESVENVVRHLKIMPAASAKDDLVRLMEENRTGDVILLLKQMDTSKLKKILAEFRSPEEEAHRFEIHRLMLEGFPEKPQLDRAIEELEALNTDQ